MKASVAEMMVRIDDATSPSSVVRPTADEPPQTRAALNGPPERASRLVILDQEQADFVTLADRFGDS